MLWVQGFIQHGIDLEPCVAEFDSDAALDCGDFNKKSAVQLNCAFDKLRFFNKQHCAYCLAASSSGVRAKISQSPCLIILYA